MRLRAALVALASVVVAYAAASTAACVGDDPAVGGVGVDAADETGRPFGAKDDGKPCTLATECSSGSCADGVCCDTDCKGVCESCNLGGSVGRCVPIPAGQDPDGECKPRPLSPGDGGASDGGDGGTLRLPDGGLTGKDEPCAGSCNGSRACGYPGESTTCGTTFCNARGTLGRLACNAGGHCVDLALDDCNGFTCRDSTASAACSKTCSQAGDCDDTHYCDGLASSCKAKKGLGVACNVAAECQSGNCVGGPPGVCCNSICNFSGATCSTGSCKCSACASGAGSCVLFYRDNDLDTFGDPNVTTIGCDVSPPAGYVSDHSDCDDTNPLVHPGADFQATAIAGGPKAGTFDYDCNGAETKETPDNLGATTCAYCGYVNVGGLLTCQIASSACSVANQQGGLSCTQACGGRGLGCCPVAAGFASSVPCGGKATKYTCSTCPSGGSGSTVSSTAAVTQRCR